MPETPAPRRNGIIVTRVSTDNQSENGSTEDQERECRLKAAAEHVAVKRVFTDVYSGRSMQRPALDEAFAYVAAQRETAQPITVAYFHRVNRVARSLLTHLLIEREFSRLGVDVRYVHGSSGNDFGSRFHRTFEGMMSEYEWHGIVERLQRGRMRAHERGKIERKSLPYWLEYGADNVITFNGRGKAIALRIVQMIEDGYTLRKAAFALTAERVPTPSEWRTGYATARSRKAPPGVWGQSTILYTVTHSALHGQIVWRSKIGEAVAPVPALVTRERFDALQKQLKANTHEARRGKILRAYDLTGRARCATCDRAVNGMFNMGSGKRYYQCNGAHLSRAEREARGITCAEKSMQADDVEARLWAYVREVLEHPDRLRQRIEQQRAGAGHTRQALTDERARLVAHLDAIDAQHKRLLQAFTLGRFKAEHLQQQQSEVDADEERTRARIATIDAALSDDTASEGAIQTVEQLAETVRGKLDKAQHADRVRLYRILDVRLQIGGGRIAVSHRPGIEAEI